MEFLTIIEYLNSSTPDSFSTISLDSRTADLGATGQEGINSSVSAFNTTTISFNWSQPWSFPDYRYPFPKYYTPALKTKLFSEIMMGPIFITVILSNILCLWVVYDTKELQCLDYFLVTLQSVMDLIFTGLFGLIDYLLDLWASFIYYCNFAGFHEVGKHKL
ncbi:uncharacterized protein LOC142347937 [Convolutriloba macropyga]|uniref:uncharacterized protein LOC142347937 n=1 Tax=Convolutriloba macropyga TaxID=536237 RepID=UPI003F525C94